jgi:hypothetical protein
MARNSTTKSMERLPAHSLGFLGKRAAYAWLLIALGAALRLRQYLEFLSMGNDEAALSRNIAARGLLGLTQPLDYRQGAPVLFLFIQKLAISILGNRDYVLAIVPLIAGLLALYFFYRISDRYLGWWGLIALYAFAFSRQVVNYTSVQKQYSTDVLIVVLLIHLYAEWDSRTFRAREFVLLGLAGALAIWVAHPSVFILPGIGLAMLIRGLRNRGPALLWGVLAVGAAWAAALGANYLISLRGLAADTYFETYWIRAFMPLPIGSDPGWFAETYRSLLYMSINRTDVLLTWGWLVTCTVGMITLWVRRRALAWILLSMFLLALAASAWHLYPLRFRLLLFMLPGVYMLLAEGIRTGIQAITRIGKTPAWILSPVLFAGLLWPSAVDARRTLVEPVRLYEMRGLVQHVQQNWQDDDAVLVSGGGETFAYYSESLGLHPGITIVDANHRIIRYRLYLDYLDRLSGHSRVWVIFAHFEQDPSYTRYSDYLEKQGTVDQLKTLGFARLYLWIPRQ